MISRLVPPLVVLAGFCFATVSSGALVHRYSFSDTAGAAGNGTMILDSVGGANGAVVGTGALFTGTAIRLPGGDGATSTAAYIDLPNGLLSAHPSVTFEAWYTTNVAQNWGRIWDFGSTAGGEVTTHMSGGEGQDYFMFAPSHGTNLNLQRLAPRNLDPAAGGGGIGPVDGVEEPQDGNRASVTGQQYHVAGAWEHDGGTGGTLTLYQDGVVSGSRLTTFYSADINDVNNWLGRSNWTGDDFFQGDINEFRIYDTAFDDAMAAASFSAGPDVVVPEPRLMAILGLAGLAAIFRRRRVA